jgi:amidophosphoribosyltransferase
MWGMLTRKPLSGCSTAQVLLNVFADEIHRAHQRCSQEASCNPHRDIQKLVLEAGKKLMRLLQGAYSCICLVKGVGLVAFRDPHGIRQDTGAFLCYFT